MQVEIKSLNINFSSRAVDEYEAFSLTNRLPYLEKWIEQQLKKATLPVIFAFQEVMPESRLSLEELLEETHNSYLTQTHPIGRSIMIFIPRELKSHEYLDDTMTTLDGKDLDRHVYLGVVIENLNLFITGHLPMDEKYRDIYIDQLSKIIQKTSLNTSIKNKIVCGDFNPFPDAGGIFQRWKLQLESGLCDLSTFLESEDRKTLVIKTFEGYPYDKIPDGVLPSNLDCWFSSLLPDEHIKASWVPGFKYKGKEYSASDHMATHAKFTL